MLKCTYIIFVRNNEHTIPQLASSLREIHGKFLREYIIVDDGSVDGSLAALKMHFKDFVRVTIITQEESGSSVSVNKALELATGHYVHFVEGREELLPNATQDLIEACQNSSALVAIGVVDGETQCEKTEKEQEIIENPLIHILADKNSCLRKIGCSGSLISKNLIDAISGADTGVYTHNMSLSMKAARHSKFVILNKVVTTSHKEEKDEKFIKYNNIKTIYNFMQENKDLSARIIPELLNALGKELEGIAQFKYSLLSKASEYVNYLTLDKVIKFYRAELIKLF